MVFTPITSPSPPAEFRDTEFRAAEFGDFAMRLKNGDEVAYCELIERYANRLRSLAASRISPHLRSKYDAEDVLQSVLRNFFLNLKLAAVELESSKAMRGLLVLMVKRKCAQYAESFSTAKRDVQRELPTGSQPYASDYHGREPAPEAAVIVADAVTHWLSSFDEMDRQIIESILQGESSASIAERLQTSQRTVQRTVKRTCIQLGLVHS